MSGEKNLNKLIRNLKLLLHEGKYVFVSLPKGSEIPTEDVIAFFREDEGITIVTPIDKADNKGYKYTFIAAWITLKVHSSLEAVGLTARVSNALAAEGISCNAFAASYYDHIFIPFRDATKAMMILSRLKYDL